MLPDLACRFKAALAREDGITMGHLKENSKGMFGGFSLFGGVPDTDAETLAPAARSALPAQCTRALCIGPRGRPTAQG